MPRAIKSLSDLKADTHAFVHHIIGRQLNNRLLVLGFTIGTEVIVLQNYGRGPVILSVRDSHVALGRGEAKRVLVEVLK